MLYESNLGDALSKELWIHNYVIIMGKLVFKNHPISVIFIQIPKANTYSKFHCTRSGKKTPFFRDFQMSLGTP